MDDPVPGEFAAGGSHRNPHPARTHRPRREMTVAMSTSDGQITGTVTYDDELFETRVDRTHRHRISLRR